MEKKCCICGKDFIEFGNNSEPIRKGTCCDSCNSKFVIPARFIPGICSYEIARNENQLEKLEIQLGEKSFEKISQGVRKDIMWYKNIETDENVIICCV